MSSLDEAIDNLSNIDFSVFEPYEESLIIKDFYANLLNSYITKKSEEEIKKDGNRIIISKIFQQELANSINKIAKNKIAEQEKNIANRFLNEKYIDIYLKWKNRIAIEIKTTLEFNPLWEAYLEALVTSENYDSFYVLSLCSTKNTYEKLKLIVNNTELKNTISDIVVFMFYKQEKWFEKGVIDFFRKIKSNI